MPVEQLVKMLKKPSKCFTAGSSRYGTVQTYTACGATPFFWKDECVIFYVRSGAGFLRANQTLYPLEPGCLCSLHQFHVFRFEAAPEEPLSLDALVYPYPEMAYFDTGYTEEDLAFGESVAVLPLTREDRGQIEQLLDLYREESGLPDGDSRLIRLSIQDQLRALYGTARPVAPLFPTPLCGQIFLYIGQHSLKALTAASVAERFQLTPVQLNRELRRVCLEGFGAVLRHAQVCNACTCLLRSNVTGTMLAKFAGFMSESALYRDFLKLRSATPQQYRQKILRDETSISRLINDQLSEIQVYVMENFQSPITCDSCAQELFLTKSVINRLLGEQYGPDVTSTNTSAASGCTSRRGCWPSATCRCATSPWRRASTPSTPSSASSNRSTARPRPSTGTGKRRAASSSWRSRAAGPCWSAATPAPWSPAAARCCSSTIFTASAPPRRTPWPCCSAPFPTVPTPF